MQKVVEQEVNQEFDFKKDLNTLLGKIKAYNLMFDKDDEKLLSDAFWYAHDKHEGQYRRSGEPYFIHPVYIANLAADYHMDITTIMAALLHDVVEDTDTSNVDIKKKFGDDVAFIVKGVTNITNIDFKSKEQKQLRNYVKLLFAMAVDIRVLIIKLFDRLHSLRTLAHLPAEKRKRKAFQALEVYFPLAERIGMEELKIEYGNLCVKWLYEDSFNEICKHLEDIREGGQGYIKDIIDELQGLANKHNVDCKIVGREKSPYSIWQKMNKKGVSFDKIYDIVAFRFIVNSVEDCYKMLGVLHSEYKSVPGRFKDYISFPKANDYQSLHTVVFGAKNQMIEIQIRTKEMDDVANYGIAAHWLYKEGATGEKDRKELAWVKDVVHSVKKSWDREEALKSAKLTLFSDSVFAFTPNGDVITLPEGATVLDFAYAIHSVVGNTCLAAKVNRVTKNIKYIVKTGDSIEIITSSKQKPVDEWLRFVKTSKAKTYIKKYLTESRKGEIIASGKAKLFRVASDNKLKLTDKQVDSYATILGHPSHEDVYLKIGAGNLKVDTVLQYIYPETKDTKKKMKQFSKDKDLEENINVLNSSSLSSLEKATSKNLMDIPITFSKCCYPIPDEPIVGVVNTGKDIAIHRANCKVLAKENDNSLISLNWAEDTIPMKSYQARIFVVADYQKIFMDVSSLLSKMESNMGNVKILYKSDSFVEMYVDIEVKNRDHLNRILHAMRGLKSIKIADRFSN
ncbi:MAG: RelA/SpoT family protein [Alphaproteobacteria bacterium]|jgi:GTP pyrophosphokinase|nr:RelA/SpoT family protein [Alphaproteobacteria bacterium]